VINQYIRACLYQLLQASRSIKAGFSVCNRKMKGKDRLVHTMKVYWGMKTER